mgnify:CR=1 FL=1
MNSQATDPRMIEALEGASSLQLYRLKALIEGMLADPRRGIAARASLHLGQPVQFVDFRDGQMRRGTIIAMRDTQATVLEEGPGHKYLIQHSAGSGKTKLIDVEVDWRRQARQFMPDAPNGSPSSAVP